MRCEYTLGSAYGLAGFLRFFGDGSGGSPPAPLPLGSAELAVAKYGLEPSGSAGVGEGGFGRERLRDVGVGEAAGDGRTARDNDGDGEWRNWARCATKGGVVGTGASDSCIAVLS